MADIIISGYHGFKNSGDEALLFAILNTLRKKKKDIDVTVLSKTPEETARVYNVNSVSRYNFFKVRKEMKNSKMLLFGGGSLLQDATSSKSILYYLAIIFLAQRCGIKTMLYANGIGPIIKKSNRFLATKILNNVDININLIGFSGNNPATYTNKSLGVPGIINSIAIIISIFLGF